MAGEKLAVFLGNPGVGHGRIEGMAEGVERQGGSGAALLPRFGGDQIGEAGLLHQKRELAGNATSGSDGFTGEFWEDEFSIWGLLDFLNEPLFEFRMNGASRRTASFCAARS